MSSQVIAFNINALGPPHKQSMLAHYINHYKPAIALITETKLKPHVRVSIPDYKVFRCDRLNNAGGETMIIVKKNIEAKQLDVGSDLFETCTVQCVADGRPIIVIAAYVPIDSKAKYQHFDQFFNQFNHSVLVGGDLNARHTQLGDIKCNSNGTNIYPLHSSGDFQIIPAEYPTCHRSSPGSFIDHFIISSDLIEVVSNRAKNIVKLSDHTGIAIDTLINFDDSGSRSTTTKRLFNRANFDAINEEIGTKLDELCIPTDSSMQYNDIDAVINVVHQIFQCAIANHVPSTTTSSRIHISNRSLRLLKEKRRLCRLLNRRLNNQRVPTQEVSRIHSSINQVGIMIKNSLCDDYSNFYHRQLQQIRSNKDAFNVVRRFSQYKIHR